MWHSKHKLPSDLIQICSSPKEFSVPWGCLLLSRPNPQAVRMLSARLGLKLLFGISSNEQIINSICNILHKHKKSEPLPNQEKVRISFVWWGKVDSNHRSYKQQIYSLSPLATREFPQIFSSFWNLFMISHFLRNVKHFFTYHSESEPPGRNTGCFSGKNGV